MSRPAQQIATRYRLELSEPWRSWFDQGSAEIPLPGSFRSALAAERLVVDIPPEIWPGFMLPDTLPLISNEYGDWICVRVQADGTLGELLHWYHGGGDWIPVGHTLAEMVVHDVVDQFRPLARQMLRGAPESMQPEQQAQVLGSFNQPLLRDWLAQHLPITVDAIAPDSSLPQPASSGQDLHGGDRRLGQISERLNVLSQVLERREYGAALERLRVWGWAEDAVACDSIQLAFQTPLNKLANSSIAQQLAMNWAPDYVRWLFDISAIPAPLRPRLLALAEDGNSDDDSIESGQAHSESEVDQWPEQNWQLAGSLALEVLQRRVNLGWAVNIAGWSKQRLGDFRGAVDIYFAGRHASAFSDQGVRMRTHWHDPQFGKFTAAQLFALSEFLSPAQRGDRYLATINESPVKLTAPSVQRFWMSEAARQLSADSPAEAYESYYRAGWDLGAQRLSEYQPILEGLVHSALAAGWQARAAIAQTHLACLKNRLS